MKHYPHLSENAAIDEKTDYYDASDTDLPFDRYKRVSIKYVTGALHRNWYGYDTGWSSWRSISDIEGMAPEIGNLARVKNCLLDD